MRREFDNQLEALHTNMILMGALCGDAIASAAKGLLDENETLREKATSAEQKIRLMAHELEQKCVRLLLQQPMARELRRVADNSLASDCLDFLMTAKYLERIGDHAEHIVRWVLYAITGRRDEMAEPI